MFIEIKATKQSIGLRKPVYGVGINDAEYQVKPKINGKKGYCPYHRVWCNMLMRCYDQGYQKKQPTYAGCNICDEWLVFSTFRAWMVKQDWQGKCLDKDLLVQGNKVYSPDTCLFVTREVNSLLNSNAAKRGELAQGVSYHKQAKKYQAQCAVGGRSNYLGLYLTPEEASLAYKKFKYKLIEEVASQQDEPLKSALLRYKL